MSEHRPSVTIVGLGLVGASVGMALRQAQVASQVVGHDTSSAATSQAKRSGAVDHTDWNLISACEKADVVVLALPLGAVRDTLKAIASELRPGCVVMDTSVLKGPVLEWATEILPESVHLVGLNPIVGAAAPAPGGAAEPRADLFNGGLCWVVPSRRAGEDAVRLATDLVRVLGAKPLFCDALEHDGLIAAVEQLPPLLSAALLESVIHEPAWRELRKLAGPSFEEGTALAPKDAAEMGDACMANRDNVLRWLDAYSAALAVIRESIAGSQPGALAERLAEVQLERTRWLQLRASGEWEASPAPAMPAKQSVLQPMLGGLWPRRRKRTTDSSSPKG